MVRKLMADNFREIWRYWKGIGLSAIFVVLISLVLFSLNLPFVSNFALVTPVLAMIVTGLSLPLILLVSYYRSLYSAEGYLTHTLPVRGRDLYLSKTITAFICLVLDLLLMGLLLYFLSIATDLNHRQPVFTGVKTIWSAFTTLDHKATVISLVLAYVCFTFFMMITQFAFVISKGSEARFHRLGLGGVVIVYLITYVLQQILSLVGMIAIPLGVRFGVRPDGSMNDIRPVFESSMKSFTNALQGRSDADFTMGLGFVILLLGLGIVYVVLTIRSLEKHSSLR